MSQNEHPTLRYEAILYNNEKLLCRFSNDSLDTILPQLLTRLEEEQAGAWGHIVDSINQSIVHRCRKNSISS